MNDVFELAIFEPVVLLPEQTAGTPWASDTSGPIALMLAVLEDAAHCLERGRRDRHPRARRLAAEARAWVRCDDRQWPFAFANVCDVLGLDLDATRIHLLADQQRRTVQTGTSRDRWQLARTVHRRFEGRQHHPSLARQEDS
jgi:hypothetical protein